MTSFEHEMNAIREKGLLRSLRSLPATGGKFQWQDRELLNFSSNDYLDLANDERLKQAGREALERWGGGATASRLMSGTLDLHTELEARLAAVTGQETALVFGSGFLTNLGLLSALTGKDDAIFADKLNHASLVDGARFSEARMIRYHHLKLDNLEKMLRETECAGRRWIASDSIFSMDGDLADVAGLQRLAQASGATLLLDEAHAVGILGERGGGLCRISGQPVVPAITVGTFSKALGSYGGFAACSHEIRDFLINRARPFIYSTALPPVCAACALRALQIIEEEPGLGAELLRRAEFMKDALRAQGLEVMSSASQIIPIFVGDNEQAVALADRLLDQGILATAIRPPTVPPGTARIRLSVTLAHSEQDLSRAAEVIAKTVKQAGAA
ncbi:8-amino-7-oxononanoate synthase [Candidatus Sumerlaeota bacterium]|nr:8-amino-7-oxononanoate synthase [Candidatus Sumerlaeota bacterium]